MLRSVLALLCACAGASALQVRPVLSRGGVVSMQFGKRNNSPKSGGKKGGEFYDSGAEAQDNRFSGWSADSQLGNADNGGAENDLATEGGIYYLAVVPFLLFALLYLTGNVGSSYTNGNF